ncbi:unnamed protein product [Symbiodinium sp. CCMP2456]|nr:unnamed protein product [Symbiodinium sp. CCMP2456]
MKAAAALANAYGDAADFGNLPAPRSRLRDGSGFDTYLGAPVVRSQRRGTARGASFLGLLRSSFDEVKASPGEEPAPAPGEEKETLKEAERHFVVCKHKLPPGEPRACEMATFEACEDKCKEHFTGDPFCNSTDGLDGGVVNQWSFSQRGLPACALWKIQSDGCDDELHEKHKIKEHRLTQKDWNGSWPQAARFCEQQGMRLPEWGEICPKGRGNMSVVPQLGRDMWAPVKNSGATNKTIQWAQVGLRMDGDICKLITDFPGHTENFQGWGEVRPYTEYVYCRTKEALLKEEEEKSGVRARCPWFAVIALFLGCVSMV